MDQAFFVGERKRFRSQPHHCGRARGRESFFLLTGRQRIALDELQDDVASEIRFAFGSVDSDDSRMVDPGRVPRVVQEPFDKTSVGKPLGPGHFDRDQKIQLQVHGEIDLPERPRSQEPKHGKSVDSLRDGVATEDGSQQISVLGESELIFERARPLTRSLSMPNFGGHQSRCQPPAQGRFDLDQKVLDSQREPALEPRLESPADRLKPSPRRRANRLAAT